MPGSLVRVIGIGASAGGIDALTELLSYLPNDTGAAFVLIMRLPSDHATDLNELLTRHTAMPVAVVEAATAIAPNHIHLISKDKNLTFEQGMLVTHPHTTKTGMNLPIDQFFHSLGKGLQENAIGLILSGAGADGSGGVRTIKEAGGLVFVQSPASAKFDGMPRAVIRLQLADRILTPSEMAQLLTDILKTQAEGAQAEVLTDPEQQQARAYLERTLRQLLAITGVDFSVYKEATLFRRLANRILLRRLENDPEKYIQLLTLDKQEAFALQKDFLIEITRFFRNPEAFKELEALVIPQIFAAASAGELIRIWVPACSTGEEAYSIALIISHYLSIHKLNVDYKIFGTDIDPTAVKLASEGIFSYNSIADLPPELLTHYFIREADFFRIKAGIRDKMLFAVHDLLRDPPFTHMDLISCRNALIYFKPPAQRSVLTTFHFALKDKGYLFLGPTESLGEVKHAYDPIDKKWKIFQKRENTQLPRPGHGSTTGPAAAAAAPEPVAEPTHTQDPFLRILVEHYAPTSLFVTPELDVIYIHGNLNELLSFPRAGAAFNLMNMLPSELYLVFKQGVEHALETGTTIQYKQISFQKYRHLHTADLKFLKVEFPGLKTPRILVEVGMKEATLWSSGQIALPADENARNLPLQDQIRTLEEKLLQSHRSSERLVTRLKTANKELQASNRELQEANEEMQNAIEESQSINEELYTVNKELMQVQQQMQDTIRDYESFMDNTLHQIILVDQAGIIKHVNFIRYLKLNKKQLIGTSIFTYTTDYQAKQIENAIRQIFAGKASERIEYEYQLQSGKSSLIELISTPVIINDAVKYAALIAQER